jgi:hypothetical protein
VFRVEEFVKEEFVMRQATSMVSGVTFSPENGGDVFIRNICSSGYKRASSFVLCSCLAFSTLKLENGVFWDVTLCGCCKNHCFGGT